MSALSEFIQKKVAFFGRSRRQFFWGAAPIGMLFAHNRRSIPTLTVLATVCIRAKLDITLVNVDLVSLSDATRYIAITA